MWPRNHGPSGSRVCMCSQRQAGVAIVYIHLHAKLTAGNLPSHHVGGYCQAETGVLTGQNAVYSWYLGVGTESNFGELRQRLDVALWELHICSTTVPWFYMGERHIGYEHWAKHHMVAVFVTVPVSPPAVRQLCPVI